MANYIKIVKRLIKYIIISTVTFVVLVTLQKLDQERSKFGNRLEMFDDVRPPRISKELVELDAINNIRLKDDYDSLYHIYNDSVDLRIIVMTFNRSQSLQKTLHSLQDFITDGRRVSLEIWIDMPERSFHVDSETLRVARNFRWTNGPVNIWIHTRHVGIIGQWLYTWRPKLTKGNSDVEEWALFVEDDVDVSKYGYRWLRAVREKYKSRNDVACYTLQNDNAIGSYGKFKNKEIKKPSNSPVFFHRLPGSWAMSPDPNEWRQFQDWFEMKRANPKFRPYVKRAALQTRWYKIFEKQGRQDTMWTMWYIYYTCERKQICGYANLPAYSNQNDTSLASNRREPGLHYNKNMQRSYKELKLLTSWSETYVQFPDKPPIFDFNGEIVESEITYD
ncbi:hypothetical protein LSH36_1835g00006 [Paralvinella palmiformis]|uniref:Uncharacterized protein n=1 Tax=Paralvinella palmiformis TaxID=53620 RepID=A0AAD9IQX9_9ANNE|nr:hypothetical protein LSH36_1835g00006 [Paralvinella palmiformis]